MTSVELKWTADVLRAFAYLEKAINGQPILVIAWFVIGVFTELVPGARFFGHLVSLVIFQAIACDLIRMVWADLQDPDVAKQEAMHRGGLPLLSLIFLHVAYLGVAFLAFFLLIIPSFIWAVRASLAIVFVCLDDVGAVEALKTSVKLTGERFWYCTRYLVPVNLAVAVPVTLLGLGLDHGLAVLMEQPFEWPIMLAGRAVAALLRAVFTLMWQMVVIACLARLYAHLKGLSQSREPAAQT